MNATIARAEAESALFRFQVFLGALHCEHWAAGDSAHLSPYRLTMRDLHRRAVDWANLAGPPGAWDAKCNGGVP